MVIKCIVDNVKECGKTIVGVCLERDITEICRIQSLVRFL